MDYIPSFAELLGRFLDFFDVLIFFGRKHRRGGEVVERLYRFFPSLPLISIPLGKTNNLKSPTGRVRTSDSPFEKQRQTRRSNSQQ
jgi:hypothetical protein